MNTRNSGKDTRFQGSKSQRQRTLGYGERAQKGHIETEKRIANNWDALKKMVDDGALQVL